MQTFSSSFIEFLSTSSSIQIIYFIHCIVHTVNEIITIKMRFIRTHMFFETIHCSSCYHINPFFSAKRHFTNRTTESSLCMTRWSISFQVFSAKISMLVNCRSFFSSPFSLFCSFRLSHSSICTMSPFQSHFPKC